MQSKWMMRTAAALVLVVILLGGILGSAQAVEIIRNGTIAAGQTIDDDVVLSGTQVTMEGTVNGTLIAAGETVVINGTVKSDVIAFGQTITLGEKAVIEGNLFVGAATVNMRGKVNGSVFGGAAALVAGESAKVGRNLYYGGYSLETQSGSVVTRDLVAGGYQLILGGTARNLRAAAAAIEIKGVISGDATLDVASPETARTVQYWRSSMPNLPAAIQPGLRIAESAKIGGKLTYTSSSEQAGAIQSAPAGGVVYQTPVPGENDQTRQVQPRVYPIFVNEGFWVWSLLRNLITILALGAMALWLAPGLFMRTVSAVQQRPLAVLGVGLLALVAVLFAIPVIAIALFLLGLIFGLVTLVDIAGIIFGVGFGVLSLGSVLFFTLFLWAGKLALALIIGSWVLSRLSPQALVNRVGAFALGALIFALLAAVPILGFLFTFLADLAGIGALWYVWRNRAVVAPKANPGAVQTQ